MKDKEKCPFCGSEEMQMDTPYVTLDEHGEYVPIKTFCCNAQKKNHKYEEQFIKSNES